MVREFEAWMAGGSADALEGLLEQAAMAKPGQDAPAADVLNLVLQFKAAVCGALPGDRRAEAWSLLDPAFDAFLQLVARAIDRAAKQALQERRDSAEFMAQRLARSTEEVDQAILRLRILFDISRAINLTRGGDLGPTLDLVTETLSSLSQVDRCSIWLANEQGDRLHAEAVEGLGAAAIRGTALDPHHPAGEPAGLLRPVAQSFLSLKPQVSAHRGEIPSVVLTVPLMDEYRVLGVLGVEGLDTSRSLTVALADLAQSVAEQLSTAVRTSYLYAEIVQLNQVLEQRVKERTRQLSQVSRELADLDRKKSDFIAIAGHELKTPLTLIRGYGEMVQQMGPGTAREELWTAAVEGILRGTGRLDAIINDIIAVAQIDNDVLGLNLEPVSVYKVMEMACSEMQAAAEERNLCVQLGAFRGLPRVQADGTRLHQAFVNLLSNAIKYTPDGGCVTIEGRLQTGDNGVPLAVEVIVADSGVGIDPQDQSRVFDKFYRVQDSSRHTTTKTGFLGGGPGLGLTIVRGVVESHGGRVWVESPGYDPERCPGSRFHVILPIDGPGQPDPTPHSAGN